MPSRPCRPGLLRVPGEQHGKHGRHAEIALVVRSSDDDRYAIFSSMPNRRLISNDASSICGSSVLIVNVTSVRPADGAGGWPTFRSLCSRQSVTDRPDHRIDREELAEAREIRLRCRELHDLVARRRRSTRS